MTVEGMQMVNVFFMICCRPLNTESPLSPTPVEAHSLSVSYVDSLPSSSEFPSVSPVLKQNHVFTLGKM